MNNKPYKRILIMAGGTGGHVFPAAAIAKALRNQGILVSWLGTRDGIEAQVVKALNIDLSFIKITGLRGNGIRRKLMAPFKLLYALIHASQIILNKRPDVVLGMGGFASGPGAIAAILLRKPLLIHEQNAIPGLTNRILARFAKRVLCAFPNTFTENKKIIVTGNPVREEICAIPSPKIRWQQHASQPRILVIGGSQGAAILNQTVPAALAAIAPSIRPQVWHQTGKNKLEQTQKYYEKYSIDVKLSAFIDDVGVALSWADLVICRAGALTIAELAAAGVGSILIPYPHAIDDHQTKNANYLVAANAAILLPQHTLSSACLAEELTKLLNNPMQLLAMAEAARKVAKPDATEQVVKVCLQLATGDLALAQ